GSFSYFTLAENANRAPSHKTESLFIPPRTVLTCKPEAMPTPAPPRHPPASMDGPTIDERANYCFGCGPANPQGLHLTFTTDTSNPDQITATAQIQLDRMHEGPPGHIHGGIVAALLDEAMSKLNRPLNVLAMTRHMEVDYLRPVPLYQPLVLIARPLNRPATPPPHGGRFPPPRPALSAAGPHRPPSQPPHQARRHTRPQAPPPSRNPT